MENNHVPDLVPGLKFRNVISHFTAEIKVVVEKENKLVMKVTSVRKFSWPEDWNLEHTRNGFKDGTYVILGGNHE